MDLIEIGKIANTHGIKGELRLDPWCDSLDVLCGFKKIYIDGSEHKVLSAKPHKNQAIFKLEGLDDVNAAMAYKNKVVWGEVSGLNLPEGSHLIRDLIGLSAIDVNSGQEFGKVTDVLNLPAHDVYEIVGEKKYLIPAVKAFVMEIDIPGGFIKFNLIEGFEQ